MTATRDALNRVMRLAAQQEGAVSVGQLRAHGVSAGIQRSAVAAGLFTFAEATVGGYPCASALR